MGGLCVKPHSSPSYIKNEPKEEDREIPIPTYSSNIDDEVALMEGKYNLLKDIHFLDYIYSISIFSSDNSNVKDNYLEKPKSYSCKEPWFNEELSEDNFDSFLDNKILRHDALYNKLDDENKKAIFKDIFNSSYISLNDGLSKNNDDFKFKKYHALIPGFLFCKGQNITKIKFLFDLFAKDGKLGESQEFSDFQFATYMYASYVMLEVRVQLGGQHEEFPKIDDNKVKELLDACQERDSKNLVKVINKKYFQEGEKNEYTLEEFKLLFSKTEREESLGFILTTKGIRFLLEKNNV